MRVEQCERRERGDSHERDVDHGRTIEHPHDGRPTHTENRKPEISNAPVGGGHRPEVTRRGHYYPLNKPVAESRTEE